MRRALVACFSLAAACGDNQQPIEVVVPYGVPAFVGYKANGAWHDAKPTDRGYRVISDGPYQFVFVCANADGFDVEELFAEPSDGDQEIVPQLFGDPCSVVRGDVATAEVTGVVAQPGFLELGRGGGGFGDAPNWTYDTLAVQGRQALVFRPITADVVVLRRDVEISAGLNPQPVVDTRTESTPLVRTPLTIHGLVAGTSVTTTTTLETSDGEQLAIAEAETTALLLPAEQVAPGEHQVVDVDIDADHARIDAADLTVKLQPAPVVTYATSDLATSVAWEHEPLDAVAFELIVSAGGTPSVIHGVATAAASSSSTLDLAVDRDAPGFSDAWRPVWSHDLASSARVFQVQASRDGNCYETRLVDRGRSTAYPRLRSRCPLAQ